MKIAVFFHIAKMNHYLEVAAHINNLLLTSKLLQNTNFHQTNYIEDIKLYEFPTLESIHNFSIKHNDYFILYLHTKGVSKPTNNQVADWRNCMLFFMVEKWQNCINKLNEGYDVVGINHITTPLPHFQGNFWWAKSSYINKLIHPQNIQLPVNSDIDKCEWNHRHKAEAWVCTNNPIIYCPYNHDINPYTQTNPRKNYEKINF